MSSVNIVPIFDPQGQIRDIPAEMTKDALANGGKLAVKMKAPDGSVRFIPHDQVTAGILHGGEALPAEQQAISDGGLWNKLTGDLSAMVKGLPATVMEPFRKAAIGWRGRAQEFQSEQQQMEADAQRRKAEGYGLLYRTAAPIGEKMLGVNAKGMEESAKQGDMGGVVGHAAAIPTAMGITAGIAKGIPAAADVVKGSLPAKGTSAMAVSADAAKLPTKAVLGSEEVFRAAAPTGGNPAFRSNVYTAAGDLAEVGRKVNLQEAKGGIINPDMRVRATVDAINDHLSEMYQTERAPQIQRNAQAPAKITVNADSSAGLDYLARNAGSDADRALAAKAKANQVLSIEEIDQLARLTNKELLGFQSMTPAERAATSAVNRRMNGLKSLDQSLGATLDEQLKMRGETGIQSYEKRYAALSQVRDQLQSRMNAVELDQPGIVKKIVRPVASLVSGSKSGIASASQAAVADVNIGRTLQSGLQKLADSGLQPQRSGAIPTKGIAGLLPEGSKLMPSEMEPIMPQDTMKTTRRIVRDPATGRMKVQYITGSK